jgi:hypothetical protein
MRVAKNKTRLSSRYTCTARPMSTSFGPPGPRMRSEGTRGNARGVRFARFTTRMRSEGTRGNARGVRFADAARSSRHECDRKGREEMREECGLRTQRPLPRAPAAVMFGLGNSFRGPALQPDRAVHDHTPNCGGGPCGSSSSSRGATFTPNVIASASARSGEATPRDFMSSLRSSWICDFAL